MPDELLDEELVATNKLPRFEWANLTVPILLLGGLLWSISSGFIGEQKFWAAALCWGMGTVALVFRWPKIGVLILAVGLLIAIFQLLMFLPITFIVGPRMDPGDFVSLDFIPFLLIIILALTNQDTVRSMSLLFRSELKEIAADESEAKTNRFLSAFENKGTRELQTIVAENRLVPEAVRAAAALLARREGS